MEGVFLLPILFSVPKSDIQVPRGTTSVEVSVWVSVFFLSDELRPVHVLMLTKWCEPGRFGQSGEYVDVILVFGLDFM